MMTPRNDSFYNMSTRRLERTILRVPTGRFAEKYDKGGFINLDYDHKDPNSEQPKRQYYDNSEAFSKIKGPVKDLYDILIDEM
jgi:hypothetical protein